MTHPPRKWLSLHRRYLTKLTALLTPQRSTSSMWPQTATHCACRCPDSPVVATLSSPRHGRVMVPVYRLARSCCGNLNCIWHHAIRTGMRVDSAALVKSHTGRCSAKPTGVYFDLTTSAGGERGKHSAVFCVASVYTHYTRG